MQVFSDPNVPPDVAIEEHNARIMLMQSLIATQGWQVFKTYAQHTAQANYSAAMKEKEAFHSAKHLGTAQGVYEMAQWPEREIQRAQGEILRLVDEKKNPR